ncbi:NlpC/P60 family protein [Sporosarcina sp. A2]|uniref:C40 family peptidase n=1 Tax=Sporosarcina sp. A2 TaxID=3393449 RepID=UPI003D7AC2D6
MKLKRLLAFGIASLLISTSVPSIASASSATDLVNTAKNYIGTPYRYGGTTTSGIDCSAYTQVVFKKSGKTLPRTADQQYRQGQAVGKSNLATGDLVFFNTSGNKVSHVGIYIGSSKFIHASTSQGVTISSINDPYYWKSKYVGAKRVANFTGTSVATSNTAKPVVNYATRAEVAEAIAKKLNLTAQGASSYKDVPSNHPQASAITAVTEAKILSGNNNGEFKPNDLLTRAEMAKALSNAFNLSQSSNVPFSDVSSTYWALPFIGAIYNENVTKGFSDGTYGINGKVKDTELKLFMERAQ